MKTVILALAILALSAVADAKTLYVNASTGNDATTYANNDINNPWLTLCRATNGATSCAWPGSTNAAQAAQCGDTVLVTGNHSTAGNNQRYLVAFQPAATGCTSANRVTFRSTTGSVLSLSSGAGPVFGAFQRDGIVWDGFSVNGVVSPYVADTGHVIIVESDDCQLLNSTITGDPNTAGGDNYNGLRIEKANDTLIKNNTITQIAQDGVYVPGNADAIGMYSNNRTTIENNYIHQIANGIYVKGITAGFTQEDTIIRLNKIADLRGGLGIAVLGAEGALIYSNTIQCTTGSPNAFSVFGFATGSGSGTTVPIDIDFYNNTAVSCPGGVIYGFNTSQSANPEYQNIRVWNNIFYDCGQGVSSVDITLATIGDTNHEHNDYHSCNTNFAELPGGVFYTYAQWQTTSNPDQDSASPASITSDPLLANVAGGDYRLCTASGLPEAGCTGASPAINLGRTFVGGTTNTGAYITNLECIGLESECDEPPPAAGPVRIRRVPDVLLFAAGLIPLFWRKAA